MNQNQIFSIKGVNSINLDKFNTIIRGDLNLGFSLLNLFKKVSSEYIENITQSYNAENQDLEKLFSAIHALKSAALTIAADDLVSETLKIEQEITNNKRILESDYHNLLEEAQSLLHYISAVEVKNQQQMPH